MMKIMIMILMIMIMMCDDLRKGRGNHAKENHHVETDKALGSKNHRVKFSVTKCHIPLEIL